MYRIEHRFTYGWDNVNDEVYVTYNEAIADLNDTLLSAVDNGLDVNPDDWRVVPVEPQDGAVARLDPLASKDVSLNVERANHP